MPLFDFNESDIARIREMLRWYEQRKSDGKPPERRRSIPLSQNNNWIGVNSTEIPYGGKGVCLLYGWSTSSSNFTATTRTCTAYEWALDDSASASIASGMKVSGIRTHGKYVITNASTPVLSSTDAFSVITTMRVNTTGSTSSTGPTIEVMTKAIKATVASTSTGWVIVHTGTTCNATTGTTST